MPFLLFGLALVTVLLSAGFEAAAKPRSDHPATGFRAFLKASNRQARPAVVESRIDPAALEISSGLMNVEANIDQAAVLPDNRIGGPILSDAPSHSPQPDSTPTKCRDYFLGAEIRKSSFSVAKIIGVVAPANGTVRAERLRLDFAWEFRRRRAAARI